MDQAVLQLFTELHLAAAAFHQADAEYYAAQINDPLVSPPAEMLNRFRDTTIAYAACVKQLRELLVSVPRDGIADIELEQARSLQASLSVIL